MISKTHAGSRGGLHSGEGQTASSSSAGPGCAPGRPSSRGLPTRALWNRGAEAGESPVWSAGAVSEGTACGVAHAEGRCRGPPASCRPTASRAPGAPVRFSPRSLGLPCRPPSPGRPRVQPRPQTGAGGRGPPPRLVLSLALCPQAPQVFPPQTYPSGLTSVWP